MLGHADGPEHARDVLEQVLTNDRADTPAVAQRRHLAAQLPGARSPGHDRSPADEAVAVARRNLDDVMRRGEPFLRSLREAETVLRAAEADLGAKRRALGEAFLWRRRGLAERVDHATEAVARARGPRDVAERRAAPLLAEIDAASANVREAERNASTARLIERLDRLTVTSPARVIEHGAGVDGPGADL